MLNRCIQLLAWCMILAGLFALGFIANSYLNGEVEVTSRMHGTSIYKLVETPGAFYGFLLVYLFSAFLMLGLAGYILFGKKNNQ